MTLTTASALPPDWYRASCEDNIDLLLFEEGGEEKAHLALAMLEPHPNDRILDLACATGRRTLELSRHGFDAIGIDGHDRLLEVAGCEAELEDLLPWFYEADPREIEFEQEFDVVLSLGGGAFEHFDSDEDGLRAFAAAARALRPGGRLLMQTPNLLYVERHLPERATIHAGQATVAIAQHWNAPIHRIDGEKRVYLEVDPDREEDPVPFQRRVYSVPELFEIFASVGLHLTRVLDEHGDPCSPTDRQMEIYVEARRL